MSGTEGWRSFSRRELLKRVGTASAIAAIPPRMLLPMLRAPAGEAADALPQAALSGTAANLTAEEARTLTAITARLIPTDDTGPGAVEAHAAQYIDRALGGALSSVREAYRDGLASLDRYAMTAKGAEFVRLSAQDQDSVLQDLEKNAAAGFPSGSASFFNLVLAHTIQGTFCDPYYGGNANFVGWDLVGYPGVRLAVTADEQRMDAHPAPTHRSAYDYPMFSGHKGERASLDREGGSHGD